MEIRPFHDEKKREESLPWVAGDISYQMSALIFHYGEVGK